MRDKNIMLFYIPLNQSHSLRKKGTTAFIGEAVEERLRMNVEYITSWHKALALHASPWNTLQALDNTGSLVDIIWYHAGDRSHDVSY